MKYLKIQTLEFQKAVDGFKKRLKDQGRPIVNVERAVTKVKEFLRYMEENGVDSLNKITQRKIEKYFQYLIMRPNLRRGGGLSASYINKHRDAILRFVEYIHERPMGESGIFIPIYKWKKRPKEILTVEEVTAMFQATDNTLMGITDRAILSMLYGCGLRRGELHNLELNDIDFARGVLRLDNTKTKHEREVVMSPRVVSCLEEYLYNARTIMLAPNSTETHVLVTEQGDWMDINTIPFRVKRMVKMAGITKNITPHSLRHSIATHLLGELTLEEVAQFLGHRNLDSTQIYTHLKEAMYEEV